MEPEAEQHADGGDRQPHRHRDGQALRALPARPQPDGSPMDRAAPEVDRRRGEGGHVLVFRALQR
jgi:hypothetical protein